MSDIDLTDAVEVGHRTLTARYDDSGRLYPSYRSDVHAVLTAALPHIERQVREQVAREIEAQRQPITVHIDYPDVAWDAARRSSARIARGDS